VRRWLALLGLLAGCAHPSRPTPPSKPVPVRLWFGGDLNLGPGGVPVLAPLAPLLRDLGPGVVNLEGAVAEAPPAGPGLKLWNAPSALPGLAAAGIRAVGLANNHAHDSGPDGPARSAAAARASGLIPFGEGAGPAVIALGGLRVALTAHDLEHGVPPHLAEELAQARAGADALVATFHVTGKASYLPPPELRQAAELALAAGARAVVAHGSHRVGPVERRGDAVIAWGLGNLAFACDCTDETDAVILALDLSGPRTEAQLLPITAGIRRGPARPSPEPQAILELLEAAGSPKLTRAADRGALP
jgi:poly-gamma-glutamate synthesis protein (capsule biosynthesis protein)